MQDSHSSIMPLGVIFDPTDANIIHCATSLGELRIHYCDSQGQVEYSIPCEILQGV